MDLSNIPPNHGGPLGDVWFRGLTRPEHLLTALRDDFWIIVAGCMMKYVRLEKSENGLSYKARVVKAFNHGVDGVAAVAGSRFRDVYALAEKRARPRIFIFQIFKNDKGELMPLYMHSLKRIHSWDIRTMQFITKELLVVLTGFPTFNVVLFKWSTNEEVMTSLATAPNLFSRLLVNPVNPCHWIEYGEEHMFVYEMPSVTRTDVIRTMINLPKRKILFENLDPLMGRKLATKIISACWTISGDFFILDDQFGIHQYIPEEKVLRWMCSLGNTFLGSDVTKIVPYSDGVAAITNDGWFLYYGEIKLGGLLEVQMAYKLSSNVILYIYFPENPESFFAVTESKGMVEGVSQGLLRDPFAISDLMFAHILSCCFFEPQSDYMAIVTKVGKVIVLECETGEPISKWKLPFKVVGVASHPILPFLFCGTTYGCVNVLDVRNLKSPKLINRRFLTREPNSEITRFGFVSQGRYMVSADTVNNRIFVQYGYPFMAFDFIDTAKVPARVSCISVPGCGKDDNHFQVYMDGKSSSDYGVVAFIINFSLRNDRLMVIASQIVDQPVTAMTMSPMKKYVYAFYPVKKGLGVVPFCDDNQWLNLQEPEYFVDHRLKNDISFMHFHGTNLYTFFEDGYIQVHDAPVIPKKKSQLPMVLTTLGRAQTHCYSDRGIKEGVVSLDGSQVIAIGHDGTFCRVRFFAKPKEPDWQTLGYDRPKLIDYQVGTYLIDQESYKAGDEFMDRIADIKVKIEQDDPVNFYLPGEETSDEEEETIIPVADTPKAHAHGEKFKYGPKKSFKGTVTRKKHHHKLDEKHGDEEEHEHEQPSEEATVTDSSTVDKKRSKKSVTIIEGIEVYEDGGESSRADDLTLKDNSGSRNEEESEATTKIEGSEGQSLTGAETTAIEGTTEVDTSVSITAPPTAAEEEHGQPTIQHAEEKLTDEKEAPGMETPEARKSTDDPVKYTSEALQTATLVPGVAPISSKSQDSGSKSTESTGSDNINMKDETIMEETIPEIPVSEPEVPISVLMEPPALTSPATTESPQDQKNVTIAKTEAKKLSEAAAEEGAAFRSSKQRKSSKASAISRASSKKKLQTGESSVVQKLLSKVQSTAVNPEPKPMLTKLRQGEGVEKTATTTAIKTATGPTSTALKGILSERIRRKQMAIEKSTKIQDPKIDQQKVPAEEPGKKEGEEQVAEMGETGEEGGETTEDGGGEETTGDETTIEEGSSTKGAFKKIPGMKGLGDKVKAAKILSMMFGKGKKKKKDGDKSKHKKKIKKFQGGQASKMLAAVEAASSTKVKAVASKGHRTRGDHTKLMKQIIADENLDPLADEMEDGKGKKKKAKPKSKKKGAPEKQAPVVIPLKGRKREGELSEASKALMMESETTKSLQVSILRDPAIYLQPDKEVKPYEGLDVSGVLTVNHAVRKKEYTEPEFFAQFEKTLLYRWHVPKAQNLRREFARFTELMEDLMFFNKQREEGNQVERKEFNFDDDRETRLKERAEKMKKVVQIQMVVRNKLRRAKINSMKYLVWEHFETKGMTLMGFRKKLEVSNYPLLMENEFYDGPISEAISWRRLELRLELAEPEVLLEANQHALRVLHHEMQFVPPVKKRLYMKSIMAIDPTIRFDEYEASDSDKSDEEFFAKVFEELGIQIPEDATESEIQGGKSKVAALTGVANTTSKAASKFLAKRKVAKERQSKAEIITQEGHVEKLKKMLLEEEMEEASKASHFRPVTTESSLVNSEVRLREQSRRDFMMNIKPSRAYFHAKGVFGPSTKAGFLQDGGKREDIEVLMEPHSRPVTADSLRAMMTASTTVELDSKTPADTPVRPETKPTKMRMVIRQKKKMKFKRIPDVVFDDEEEDLSGPENEAVATAQQKKFDEMDDEFKERFDTINNIFYGSSLVELVDMYQFKPAPYRYSQFDLGSRHELWRHQFIIMSEIYQLKKFFNRQFELLRNAKGYSLRKMAERNERIREIYFYLKVDLDILDEKWRIPEDPSQIFTVTKDEVPVERYLTAEQRRLEEQKRLDDLARRRTRMAEFRKKALHAMMDNRLEVKKEEILVNDIPKPNFMLEKDPLEYTLEEYLQSLQYLEAVEALDKARVDLIKELEEELGRLYRANALDINTIDLRVHELSLMKFQFHQNFQMEETRILRAIRQLRLMEELDKEEKQIGKIIVELKSSMKSAQNMVASLENKKVAYDEEIAKIVDQEKECERNFRRDLGDVGQYFEFFYKNYKKKPKLSLKGLNKADVYETMVKALRSDNIRNFAKENGEIGRIVVMAIYDFEDPLLMPKDCPRSYWDRFNRVRRERLVCEYQTKTLVAEIDRISEAINECNRKEDQGTAAIAAVMGVISHKNDLKTYIVANVEFQMVLGKGQCEIDCWSFDDHVNATIILIENVEKLNHKIFEASEKLIKEMTRTASVHRDIKEIEWRFLVVEMATKDLKKVSHDVGCFKPTRKLLEVLRNGINLDTMYTDRIALVDYLKTTYIKYQKIFLRTKRKLLRFYQRQTQHKHETNEQYKGSVFEQTEKLVSSQVNKISPDFNAHKNDELFEKRTMQLMLRGYLNRKIVKLCNEVERLEEELERQYQRTYPVL